MLAASPLHGVVCHPCHPLPHLSSATHPQVAAAASPYLTGNADADADILRFYAAKAALMAKLGGGG